MSRESSLALQTGGDRFGSVVEGKEERVPLGADLYAAVRGAGATKQRLVGGQQLDIPFTQLAKEASGALDVGHDKGDDPGGQRCRRVAITDQSVRTTPVAPARPVPDHPFRGPSHRATSCP